MSTTPKNLLPPIEITEVQPLDKIDETLIVKFAEDIAAQAGRLDDLAKQLITLQIAIPGLYAATLKLVQGKEMTTMPITVIIAFGAWLLGLAITLASLIPAQYVIDRNDLGAIQHYFVDSAKRKWQFLIFATFFTYFGICMAIWSSFIS